MLKNQQVIRYGSGWAVRAEGNTKVARVFNSKYQAVNEAKKIVRNTSSSVFIYNSIESLGSADIRGGLFCDR